MVEQLPTEKPDLLLIDLLSAYFTDLPDLYQTIKVLEHTLAHTRRSGGGECRVVLACSSTAIAPLNAATLGELITGQLFVSSQIHPESKKSYFSVQGTDFVIKKNEEGLLKIITPL